MSELINHSWIAVAGGLFHWDINVPLGSQPAWRGQRLSRASEVELSVPERSEGTEVSKIAVRHGRISVLAWRRKDFGVAGEAAQGFWRGGVAYVWGVVRRGVVVVCLSVCYGAN